MKSAFKLFFALLICSLLATVGQAQTGIIIGQESVVTPDINPDNPEAIRAMVAQMPDDQVRKMLLERLDAVAQAETQAIASKATFSENVDATWTAFYRPIVDALTRVPTLLTKQMDMLYQLSVQFGINGLLTLFGLTVLILASGFAIEKLFSTWMQRHVKAQVEPPAVSLRGTLGFLLRRFSREIAGLAIFYVAARGVGALLLTPEQIAIVAPFVRNLVMFPRLVAVLSRFVLAPKQPNMRLVSLSDYWAGCFHRNFIGLVMFIGAGYFVIGLNIHLGVSLEETRIGFWFNLGLHLYIITLAWLGWDGLTAMMRGNDSDRTSFDEFIARSYPPFAIGASILTWITTTLVAGFGHPRLLIEAPQITTMFWLLMTPLIDTGIRGIVRHLQPPMIGHGLVAEQAYKSNKRSCIRIGRVLALGLVVLIIANAWHIDLAAIEHDNGNIPFAAHILEFIIISAVGYIVYEFVSLWINRSLTRERSTEITTDEVGGEGGGAGGSRLATVLPLILMTARATIVTIFGLLAIGCLGIDTTPLLAGAGIFGLAIGFGAQKLVADIVSGVFFLIDDAFRVGEYVDVGDTRGSVEKISIRSMQLRHHRGNVHTIPYGSIEKVTNFSRDWVIMKLMFTVPFDTDPNQVKKIFKRIGAEMLEDPLFKEDFLEPFKSQGVFQFDDVGIVMRGKFMAKPGTQFTIRKEIYNRVRNEFKANGIEFARREVRVDIPGIDDAKNLSEADKAMVKTVASNAVDAQIMQEQQALTDKNK